MSFIILSLETTTLLANINGLLVCARQYSEHLRAGSHIILTRIREVGTILPHLP